MCVWGRGICMQQITSPSHSILHASQPASSAHHAGKHHTHTHTQTHTHSLTHTHTHTTYRCNHLSTDSAGYFSIVSHTTALQGHTHTLSHTSCCAKPNADIQVPGSCVHHSNLGGQMTETWSSRGGICYRTLPQGMVTLPGDSDPSQRERPHKKFKIYSLNAGLEY